MMPNSVRSWICPCRAAVCELSRLTLGPTSFAAPRANGPEALALQVNKEMASVYRSGRFVGLLVSQLSYIQDSLTLTYKLQLSHNEERCRSFEEGCDERTQCLKWWKVRAFGIEMTGKWTWQTMYCLQDKNCSTRSCKAEKTTRTSKIGYFRAWSMIERRVISGFACVSSVLFPHDSIYWNVELSNMSNPTCLFPFFLFEPGKPEHLEVYASLLGPPFPPADSICLRLCRQSAAGCPCQEFGQPAKGSGPRCAHEERVGV